MWTKRASTVAAKQKPCACAANSRKPFDLRQACRTYAAGLRVALYFVLACALIFVAALQSRQAAFRPTHTAQPPAPALAAQLPPPPWIGVTHAAQPATPHAMPATLLRLEQAGFVWVRRAVDWPAIQPQPRQYDWRSVDLWLEALAASRLIPMFVLDDSPSWARTPQDQTARHRAPPSDPATLAHFGAAFARRAAAATPHLPARIYQIWHEPNLAPNWGERHIDPSTYAQLVKAVAPAIRAADPGAIVLTAGLAPTRDRGHLALDEAYFLQRFLAAGGGAWVDGIAIQPYGFAEPPQARRPAPTRPGFDRVLYLRRSLEAAGYAHLPLWIAQFGWNREANATWRAVTPAVQTAYAAQAVALAGNWPWLHGLGWAGDIDHGFALTPSLISALVDGETMPPHPPPQEYARIPHWAVLVLLAAAFAAVVQRAAPAARLWVGAATARAAGAGVSGQRFSSPLAMSATGSALIGVYFLATWPPLLALCWLLTGLWVWHRPHHGVYAAALVLPFYFQHKDVQVVDWQMSVAPMHVFVAALLPPLGRALWERRSDYAGQPILWLGLSWLVLNLVAGLWGGLLGSVETGAPLRHWPAFGRGFADLALAPVVLAAAVGLWIRTPDRRTMLLICLALGGVATATVGFLDWMRGGGVLADGITRLTGPYFSPNHAALYLLRTLFLVIGLALAWRGPHRLLCILGGAWLALALALTGSRGALLLGIPVGLAWLGYRYAHSTPKLRISHFALAVAGLAIVGLMMLGLVMLIALPGTQSGWARLTNSASVLERLELWRVALELWRSVPWSGVGPGGFFWTFPAHIRTGTLMDSNMRHAHNVWLEMLTTWGMLGALWFGALGLLLRGYRLRMGGKPDWRTAGMVAACLAGLAHGQVDAFLTLPDLVAWNGLALGYLLTVNRRAGAS